MMHIADNPDALLDYLYEEGDPAQRLKIAKHLQECVSCSVAMVEFQSVRGMLAAWTPPLSDSAVRLVREEPVAEVPVVPSRWAPAMRFGGWSQAAAALLLFTAGMAASQMRFDFGDGAMTVRMRSAVPSDTARNVSIMLPSSSAASDPELPRPGAAAAVDMNEIEKVVHQHVASHDSPAEAERLLQRVRSMIDQSEQRQQRELALRLSQVAREVDTQHQADWLQIQQNLGQQQQVMDYLVRTSGGVK